jgi:succinate dehydrogenase / fumarate reductase cytochrome b subunit
MAITGIVAMGYVLAHMIGNLHLYEGPEEVNDYAEALRELGGDLAPRELVLWGMRSVLIVALVIHLYAAYRLTVINHRARPQGYQSKRDYIAADYASRSMRYTGVWLTGFIIYHLLDLTWGVGLAGDEFIHGDPYNNVVESFENPVIAGFYIVSMAALYLHLYHGAWSLFQSLGASSPRYNSWRRGFAAAFATIILVGNVSFPVAVQLGIISQDDRCWPTPEQIEEAEALLSPTESFNVEALVAAIDDGTICPFPEQAGVEEQSGTIELEPVGGVPTTVPNEVTE